MEAAAFSHIHAKDAELNNIRSAYTSLCSHLDAAEHTARTEYRENHSLRDRANAEFSAQAAKAKKQEQEVIQRLESVAQSAHETALHKKEQDLIATAESKHSEVVNNFRSELASAVAQLAEATQRISALEQIIQERDGQLHQVRQSADLMIKDLHDQQNTIQSLQTKNESLVAEGEDLRKSLKKFVNSNDHADDLISGHLKTIRELKEVNAELNQGKDQMILASAQQRKELFKTQESLSDQQLKLAQAMTAYDDVLDDMEKLKADNELQR